MHDSALAFLRFDGVRDDNFFKRFGHDPKVAYFAIVAFNIGQLAFNKKGHPNVYPNIDMAIVEEKFESLKTRFRSYFSDKYGEKKAQDLLDNNLFVNLKSFIKGKNYAEPITVTKPVAEESVERLSEVVVDVGVGTGITDATVSKVKEESMSPTVV